MTYLLQGGHEESMKKYTQAKIKDRNERLYKFWLAHPGMTYQSIANLFRISKPEAWYLIKKMQKDEREG